MNKICPSAHCLLVVLLQKLAITTFAVALGGCGGGGGDGNNPPPNLDPVAQTLTFADPGPVELSVEDSFENPATGQGEGAITYHSSDDTVATVDSKGLVKILAVGESTISAETAADSRYLSASASYQIVAVPKSATMTAWIGENDTLATFSAVTDGYEFYRSTEKNCDLDNYSVCKGGQLTILNGQSVTDTAAKIGRPAYYDLISDSYRSSATVSAELFGARVGHKVVSFKEKLWLIGGYDGYAGYHPRSDIWSSSDGMHWEREVQQAPFPGSELHNFVEFNDKLFLIVGYGYPSKTEIWSSSNGTSWELITDDLPFSGRLVLQVASHSGKLWIVGGIETTESTSVEDFTMKNDVWASEDGVVWDQITNDGSFSYSSMQKLISFNSRLWLLGAPRNDFTRSEIWSSENGAVWEQISNEAPFGPRHHHQLIVYADKLWVVGGDIDPSFGETDVWFSDDGLTWTKSAVDSGMLPRSEHQVVTHLGQLQLLGGQFYGVPTNEVWASSDGVNWTKRTSGHKLPPSVHHQLVYFEEKFMLITGYGSSYGSSNDVWTSSTGVDWSLHVTNEDFPRRVNHQATAHADKLWLIGGEGDCCTDWLKNEVWSSSDGTNWKLETNEAGFSARRRHQVVSHNGKLWIIGGEDADSWKSDVWSSEDGVHWEEVTPNAGFTPRIFHQAVSFHGRLWVLGGNDDVSSEKVLWASEDGANWVSEDAVPQLAPRYGHQLVVHNDKLWLIGGYVNGDYTSDVWSSSDGINWNLETDAAPFSKRAYHQVVSDEEYLWLIGGYNEGIYDDVWRSKDGKEWRKLYSDTFKFSVAEQD